MPPAKTPHADDVRRPKIFISYRRKDLAGATVAELLYDAIRKRFGGKQVFMDIGSLRGGDPFREDIASALASCRTLIVVIGPQWLDAADEQGRRRLDDPSDIVRWEILTAIKRGILVIPVLVQGTPLPREEELPDDLKPLSGYQAVVIQRGKMDEYVDDLVRLLRRKLRRLEGRVKRVLVVAEAALLCVAITLLYFFLAAATPVRLPPAEDGIALPKVSQQFKQELSVEGLTGLGGGGVLILRYDGVAVADLRVDVESGRASDKTLDDLEQSESRWGQEWSHVAYTTEPTVRNAAPNLKHSCATVAEVRPAHDTDPPTRIRFFQTTPPRDASAYREVSLRADRELIVTLKIVQGEADGPGCSKRLQFGGDPSVRVKGYNVEVYTAHESALTFKFGQRDTKGVSGRTDFMRFGEPPNDTIEPFTLVVAPLRARSVNVRPLDDVDNRGVIFNASTAEDFLLLRRLSVGPDYLRFKLEGNAYVKTGDESFFSVLKESVTQRPAQAALLLTAVFGLTSGLLYTVARL